MFGELFDRAQPWEVSRGQLPHWTQAGVITFVTFRTADSLPLALLRQWEQEKQEWVRNRGYPDIPYRALLPNLPVEVQRIFRRQFSRKREQALDTCHGTCPFRDPACVELLANTLLHFDGERYCLGDVVIMPNHVHLLASFPAVESMRRVYDSWLRFSAREINRYLKRTGNFWQREPFDHLVRSIEQYDYLRAYIADNPRKAQLREGEFWYRRLSDTRKEEER